MALTCPCAEPAKQTANAATAKIFVHGRKVKFVEYNAETPSSLMDQASLNEVLGEVGAMQDLAEQYQLRQFSPEKHLLDTLMSTYREWGGTGVPNIAILDWEGLPTADEFVLLRDFFTPKV